MVVEKQTINELKLKRPERVFLGVYINEVQDNSIYNLNIHFTTVFEKTRKGQKHGRKRKNSKGGPHEINQKQRNSKEVLERFIT